MFLSCRSWPPDSRFDSWSNVLDELLRKAVVFFLFLWHFDLWDPCLRHGLLRFLDLLSPFFFCIYIFFCSWSLAFISYSRSFLRVLTRSKCQISRSLVGDATSVCVCGLSPLPLALDKDELNRLGSHTSIFLAAAEEEEEFLIHHRFTIVSSSNRRYLCLVFRICFWVHLDNVFNSCIWEQKGCAFLRCVFCSV